MGAHANCLDLRNIFSIITMITDRWKSTVISPYNAEVFLTMVRNSLLHEIPAKDLQKSQRVQNCLARVVTKAPRGLVLVALFLY